MSYDIPHACELPEGCDVLASKSIVDDIEQSLGWFDQEFLGDYLSDLRPWLFGHDDDEACLRHRLASDDDVND